MELACSTWNLTEELESGIYADLPTLISDLASAGFDAVEIMGYHLKCIDKGYLVDLREHAAHLGMCLSAIDARNLKLGGKWPDYRTDIALIKTWIEAAAILDCPTVVVFLGGFETTGEREKQLCRDSDAMIECAEFAAPRHVRLGIENHRIYLTSPDIDPPGREIEDILMLMKCFAEMGADVGTVPDTDNVFLKQHPALTADERGQTLDAFRRMIPYATHVHVKIKGPPNAPEPLQFKPGEILSLLRSHNYDGTVGFEFMKPVAGDKMEVLAATVADYRRLLGEG